MDWKKIGKKLLFPPIWVMVLLTLFTAVTVPYVLIKNLSMSVLAYAVYVVAFYTVVVVTVFCVMVLPKQYQQIKQKIYDNPLGNRYMTDRAFRTKVSLYTSLGVNLLYVGINLLSYWMNRSWWFVVLACYYVILSLMRFLLVGYVRRNEIGSSVLGEWKRARMCAFILLLVNLSLSGAVLMILYQNRGYTYNGIMIYVMAAYTFYITVHAIVDMVKYRKLGSPVLSTAKTVSLSAALVSMLNLETAMFAQFGAEMPVGDQRIMIAATGGGISVVVVTLSILLIVKATKEIRSCSHGTQR